MPDPSNKFETEWEKIGDFRDKYTNYLPTMVVFL